ncbi:hypothetical protein [Curtobacterium flaccumfaciens]|uniref:hypothetical protein n=1 Tax=Curtobacterium flaccumfaciens TaxID=2035 RepID=UPI003449FCCD
MTGSKPYRPQLPDDIWAAVSSYVLSLAARAEPRVTYSSKELLPALSRLASYTFTAGYPLEDAYVLDPITIDQFALHHLSGYNRASRNTMRARARRVSEAILGEDAAATFVALGKAEASRPYRSDQLTGFQAWARHQPTSERRTSALALLALGFGAGLTGAEIINLRLETISFTDTDASITLPSRRVPVLQDWTSSLRMRWDALEGKGWAFRSEQRGGNGNLITDFVSRAGSVPLQARRMRATWLVHHLDACTPLRRLLSIAGLESAAALDRYLAFASP